MSPETARFNARLRPFGLKSRDFARLCGVAPLTVSRWAQAGEYPSWVDLLLSAWAEVDRLRRQQRRHDDDRS